MTSAQESCTFCEILPAPESAFDVNQAVGDHIRALPALGMLLPGYLLAVTNEHVTSFSQLEKSQLHDVSSSLDELESQLTPLFGEYFRCESGSDNTAQLCGSGGCIEHAHQHLVPAADVGDRMLDMLPWERLDAYEDIADYRGRPYLYLGKAGLHHIVKQPSLPSQWMRRQVAAGRNLETWDWAIDSGRDNLDETFRKLGIAGILGQMTEDAARFTSEDS